jgi:hypothetical protein
MKRDHLAAAERLREKARAETQDTKPGDKPGVNWPLWCALSACAALIFAAAWTTARGPERRSSKIEVACEAQSGDQDEARACSGRMKATYRGPLESPYIDNAAALSVSELRSRSASD